MLSKLVLGDTYNATGGAACGGGCGSDVRCGGGAGCDGGAVKVC